MTRLFTKEFKCIVCCKEGPMGWLYRCTQDRELLIEDDMERGYGGEKLDAICDLYPQSMSPRKGSPAARASKLAVLEEFNNRDIESYSASQLNHIITQRSHVLDVAKEQALEQYCQEADQAPKNLPRSISRIPSALPVKKPWLLSKTAECQFKCCYFCRPSLDDRSYLSLNGIADGDIPPTAITGFGFHLEKRRPVGLVKDVLNLGLRVPPPPPPPRSESEYYASSEYSSSHSSVRTPTRRPHSTRRRSSALGLGLLVPSPLLDTPPPPSTTLSPPPLSLPIYPAVPHLSSTSKTHIGALQLHTPHLTPLPPQTLEEIRLLSQPMTLMEKQEERDGAFGRAPLEVKGGVAMLEESVGWHVADVVTQF
ncbi:hypothetical protein B7494_g1043 [Chlorociboria aeruginascens]|nr:hypothetical protein B7494_g1043 [Chlorociboria aeruginascens]